MQIITAYLRKIFNFQRVLLALILLFILDSILGIYLLKARHEETFIMEPLEIENKISEENEEENKKIKVDLKGAVQKPGVYEITNGTILNDLIKKAGGFNENASIQNISLVYKLSEGLVINIPVLSSQATKSTKKTTNKNTSAKTTEKDMPKEEAPISSSQSQNSETSKPNDKEEAELEVIPAEENKIININTASKEELISLNGIGSSKAQAIIDYRNTNGLFATIEEIKNVKGIGEAIFAKIKDYITV